MGKLVVVASNLRDDGRDVWMKLEVIVVNKKTANAPEIERRKKILDIQIENMPPFDMRLCVGYYRMCFAKAVREGASFRRRCLDFLSALIENF